MQMLQAQKAAQMQRDPSDMDGNRVRAASPGSAENAPSPSKRPRLEGAPFNPNAGAMMQNGRQMQGMPGQQQVGGGPNSTQAFFINQIRPNSLTPNQLQALINANPNSHQLKAYAANLQQHHGKQMPTNPMANAGGPQNQGSPMLPQGPDGQNINQFYNQDMGGGNMRAGPGNGQNGSSNHALQDYQMQLMLLEQQNKKRLMMARQEQDGIPRPDGPNGPGGPGGPQGPNPQGFQAGSPPGQRNGASPNPSEQMKRASQQMNNPQNMGSPLPDGAQNRSSPEPDELYGRQHGSQRRPASLRHEYEHGKSDGRRYASTELTPRTALQRPNEPADGGSTAAPSAIATASSTATGSTSSTSAAATGSPTAEPRGS